MIKTLTLGIFAVALSFFAFGTVHGQTATTTPSPTTSTVSPTVTSTPAVTVPSGAPATGRG